MLMNNAATTATPARTILAQIGSNLLAISGGRYAVIDDTTVSLPAGRGYRVEVTYERALDLYTVRQVFVRGLTRKVRRSWDLVDAATLSEVAYRASLTD